MFKAALITNVLAHYRVPCFEQLAARLPGQIDFFLLAETMPHRQYVLATSSPPAGGALRLPLQVLPGRAFHRPPFDDTHWNDIRPALRGYDLIILSGWDEPSYMLLWGAARVLRKRIGFWIESTLNDGSRATWKEIPKRVMLRAGVGAVATGKNAAAYCEWLGMRRQQIFIAPNAVNSDYFAAQARRWSPQRAALRRELGLDGVVILFVGRMVELYKRVSILLQAHKQLEAQALHAELVLVGQGPDRAAYERTCAKAGLKRVRFENFMNHDALSRYYAAADIFVLPSRSETWGLVMNEAMEFGLPIVTTSAVGGAADLVREGENGFVVPPDDAHALAHALQTLVREGERRERMGAASSHIIKDYTPETWADGFARALQTMAEGG